MYEGFERRPREKKIVDIIFDSRDGLIYWMEKFDDGTLGKPESTSLGTGAGAESLRVWREHKMRELGIEDPNHKKAA